MLSETQIRRRHLKTWATVEKGCNAKSSKCNCTQYNAANFSREKVIVKLNDSVPIKTIGQPRTFYLYYIVQI